MGKTKGGRGREEKSTPSSSVNQTSRPTLDSRPAACAKRLKLLSVPTTAGYRAAVVGLGLRPLPRFCLCDQL